MNKAMRCEAVSKLGHRCNKKADHETRIEKKAETAKLHSAFGYQW